MRTNSIDATAFRCLAEYKTLVDICNKLYDEDDPEGAGVKAVDNYLDELMGVNTAKEIRDLHNDKLNVIINKKINPVLDITFAPHELLATPRNIND